MSRKKRQRLTIDTLEPLVLLSASAADLEIEGVVSAIALDLNSDGVIGVTGQTTAKDKSGITAVGDLVEFDFDADGKDEKMEWFAGDGDGILVDFAKIQGEHIAGDAVFGDSNGAFIDGFESLAAFDQDGNRLLEQSEFSQLRLWIDDGDAELESGELQKLSDHDIFSISLRTRTQDGLTQSWAFFGQDDGQLLSEDVWFVVTDTEDQHNALPIAVDDAAVTESGTAVVISVLDNDSDPENQPLTITGHTQAEHGEIELNADNTLTYTAPAEYSGVVYVQYSITDGNENAIATVRIDVTPTVNIAPNEFVDTTPGSSDTAGIPIGGATATDGFAENELASKAETRVNPPATESSTESSDPSTATEVENDSGPQSIITGTDASEWVNGTVLDDVIHAGGGDDEIYAPIGNNRIDGGDGIDSLIVYEGNIADYEFSVDLDGNKILEGLGADGQRVRSVLMNVEKVIFNDGVVDIQGSQPTLPASGNSADDATGAIEKIEPTDVVEEENVGNEAATFDPQLAVTTSTDRNVQSTESPEAAGVPVTSPVIAGTAAGEWIRGTAENDIIQAGDGDDSIYTPGGYDRVDGGDGIDTFFADDEKARKYTVIRQSNGSYLLEGPDSRGEIRTTILTNVEKIMFKDRLVNVEDVAIDVLDDLDDDASEKSGSGKSGSEKSGSEKSKSARSKSRKSK